MDNKILSVSQINEYLRVKMDSDPFLGAVSVRGEISNYKLYPSGHHYFTLKDENAALRCVLFKGNAFRLRFRPENGMKVIVFGKISVFPRDGAYQLYCTSLTAEGAGDLHIAFEQLKKKLAAQGLFDPQHKKAIPQYPQTIGVVTSPAGAAVHDMLRILKKRYPLSKVVLIPTRVQGTEAPAEIAAAIAYANHYKLADVLIVGRGGGSIEDLWSFNEEVVAHAIYQSQIPVISAVGHEPDVTISDYVADLRAATPSNAAELAVPDQQNLRQSLDMYADSMQSALLRQIKGARVHLKALAAGSALQSPVSYIENRRNALALCNNRLQLIHQSKMQLRRQRFLTLTAKLDAMSPLKVLTRGYSVVKKENGSVVSSVKQISQGEKIAVNVSDGSILATVTELEAP